MSANEIELRMIAGQDSNGSSLDSLTGYSSTVVKRAFAESKPFIVTGSDEGKALGSESAVLHNLRSIMAVPLAMQGKTLGVVYLDSRLAKGLFTNDDLELLSAICTHIAIAFETARIANVELEKALLKTEMENQAALLVESKKNQALLDNMHQAVFSINRNGTIVDPVSKYSEKVFGKQIAGSSVMDVLYDGLKSHGEQQAALLSAISTVFGEDQVQWELMEDVFPKSVKASANGMDSPPVRSLKVQAAPIWDASSILEKILFVVEDVTQLEALEAQVQQQRNQAEIFEELLSGRLGDTKTFLESAKKTIHSSENAIENPTEANFLSVLRDLHTLKGNARLFKLKKLSLNIHDAESLLLETKKTYSNLTLAKEKMNEILNRLKRELAEYGQAYERIESVGQAAQSQAGVNTAALNQLCDTIKEVSNHLKETEKLKLKLALDRLSYDSARETFAKFDTMVYEIAAQMDKDVVFELTGDALLNSKTLKSLQECIVHLLRNSLDHGLEGKSERALAGKPARGKIHIDCKETDTSVEISVEDDGRGIDGEKIAEIAIQKGLVRREEAKNLSIDEKIALIFLPEFSSRETANDISGRGIGMNAVKETIEKIGGNIAFKTKVGLGSVFILAIPLA